MLMFGSVVDHSQPMLSMLRYMADTGENRKVSLIWSNRTRNHIVFQDEFTYLENNLPGLQAFHLITDDPTENEKSKKLDQAYLEKILSNRSRQSAVFVCGPPQMMKAICKALARIGFKKRAIITEQFSL